MSVLRNRFLNTASVLLAAPNDEGKKPVADVVEGVEDAGNDAGADEGDAGDVEAAGADGDDADDSGAGNSDDEAGADGAGDEDDDPDLADLTPEQRKKVKARIEKETGWRDRQLSKVHARRRAAEEDVTAAAAIIGRQPPVADDPNRKFTSEEVKAEAARLAAAEQYDRDCNTTDAAGRKVFGDKWSTALSKLPKLGGVEVEAMVDILATDSPHVVLYSLADPDTYERVMALPPARRRNEFVKLSLKAPPAKAGAGSQRPADQPAPPRTIQGGRRVAAQAVDLRDDKIDDDKWYEERNKTRRKKFTNVA